MVSQPRLDVAICFGSMATDFCERISCCLSERVTDVRDVLAGTLGCFHPKAKFGKNDGREIDEVALGKGLRPSVDRGKVGSSRVEQNGHKVSIEKDLLHQPRNLASASFSSAGTGLNTSSTQAP